MASYYTKIVNESLRHLKAFEYWISLGDKRTYKSVAEEFKVSECTIFKWAHSFNWKERLEERQQEYAKKLALDSDKKLLEYRKKNIERLEATLQLYDKKLAEGKVDVTQLPDILKVIELQAKLTGAEDHGLADPIKKKSEQEENKAVDSAIVTATFTLTNNDEDY